MDTASNLVLASMNLANDASADPPSEQTWKVGWLLDHSSLPKLSRFLPISLDWRPIGLLGPVDK